jgi:hypothetical protein
MSHDNSKNGDLSRGELSHDKLPLSRFTYVIVEHIHMYE